MLSIIIPTLNEECTLPKLLESIRSQDFKNYEIIVSDANSEDGTQQIAKKFGCILVSSKKRRPACQRNNGAKKAQGEWFLFLDADSEIPEDFLKNTVREVEKKNLKAAGFYIKIKKKGYFYKFFTTALNFLFKISQCIRPTSIGVAILSNKKVHFEIGGFDESLLVAEDYDYTYKIFKKNKIKMINSTFVYYSPRRLEREGRVKVILKWLKLTFYVLICGSVRKKIVEYEFGNHN